MPLPQFLLLVLTVIVAAAMTLWLALSSGVPFAALVLVALSAALAVHLTARDRKQ